MPVNRARAGTLSICIAAGLVAVTLSGLAQSPADPARRHPAPETAPPQGQGRGAPMWEADFSKKAQVPVLSPAEQAKQF